MLRKADGHDRNLYAFQDLICHMKWIQWEGSSTSLPRSDFPILMTRTTLNRRGSFKVWNVVSRKALHYSRNGKAIGQMSFTFKKIGQTTLHIYFSKPSVLHCKFEFWLVGRKNTGTTTCNTFNIPFRCRFPSPGLGACSWHKKSPIDNIKQEGVNSKSFEWCKGGATVVANRWYCNI